MVQSGPPKGNVVGLVLVLGKLNTKDRLVRMNIILVGEENCILCHNHLESVEHLFFSCNYSWKLWSSCLNKWNVNWVMPTDPRSALES